MAAVPGSEGDHDHNGNRDGGGSKPTDPSDVAGNGNLGPDPVVDVINLDDAPLSMRGSAPAAGGQAAGGQAAGGLLACWPSWAACWKRRRLAPGKTNCDASRDHTAH